jgi:hypothetical protein
MTTRMSLLIDIITLGRKSFPRVTKDTGFPEYIPLKMTASFDTKGRFLFLIVVRE